MTNNTVLRCRVIFAAHPCCRLHWKAQPLRQTANALAFLQVTLIATTTSCHITTIENKTLGKLNPSHSQEMSIGVRLKQSRQLLLNLLHTISRW